MKKTISQHLRMALGCVLTLLVFAGSGQAQTATFNYQGSLTIGGTLVNGSYDLQFKLYDQLTGGALQGSPNTVTVSSVTVSGGVFSVDLDFGAAAFPGAARYLEISVRPAGSGSFTTLSPRQQLTSTPYAIRSLSAASADAATTAATAMSATTAVSATNFTGSLVGDVTGTQGATVVSLVGGVTANNVASGASLANNATYINTPSTIVKRDASGNFTAGVITATGFSGSGASLTNLNASNIASGTLADARLSSNVALLNTSNTFTANQTISANLFQSGSLVQFTPTNGFVAGGTSGSGSIPATGAGVRMMWYPSKWAFRVGQATGTEWDDANVGQGSMGLGSIVKASGPYSVAMGINSTASGAFSFAQGNGSLATNVYSVAMGNAANSGGDSSIALGKSVIASGNYAVALGLFTSASGQSAVALGENNQANGNNSVALGRYASTGSRSGSFVFNDSSDTNLFSASTNNQFNVRATGGLRFFASSDTSDETKPGLFVSGTTGNTQINGDLSVSGTITGTVNANVASATNFTGSLSGDVIGTQSATVVAGVGGVTASNVANGATLANNATNANTPDTIVKRDASGNFTAGTVTATGFSGSGVNLTNLSATNITSGTLSDSLLSSNVAKLNTAQTFTADQTVAANLFQSGSLVQFTPTNGFVVGGTSDSGSIPATGTGVRTMWYPNKAAFRAGRLSDNASSTFWDDANIGYSSVALGQNTLASGDGAFAMGHNTKATGSDSAAIGYFATASGGTAIALGQCTASSLNSVCLGSGTSSGISSVSMGSSTTASGNYTTAMGLRASTNGMQGSFVYGDSSSGSNTMSATATNQFNVRAAGGYRFFASSDTSDSTKPGMFISGTTGNTQINGDLTVSGSISGGSFSNVALLNATNTFTANQTVNANLIQSGSLVQFTPTNGLVAFGTEGSGSIPATGAGIRMMWYPNKYAFRAGKLDGSGFHGETYWDDSNIGNGSFAFGYNTLASGDRTFATGYEAHATGSDSIAIGRFSFASASDAIALGGCTASGQNSTCLIDGTASADYSLATGFRTTASGDYSTAMGQRASTNGQKGSFVYGDSSATSTISATTTNQFVVRAQNMWFGTTSSPAATSGRFLETSTGAYLSSGGTWTNSSSRALKTNFAPVSPRDVLQKVLQLPIQTWNYKAEDAKVRHIGAISQDFQGLFGFGDSAETISTVDADGVALAAIQGLHQELKDRDAKLEQQQQELGQLKQQVKQQQAVIDGLRQLLCAQNPQAEVCRK